MSREGAAAMARSSVHPTRTPQEDAQTEAAEQGVVFKGSPGMIKEVEERMLLGATAENLEVVKRIRPGTPVFLLDTANKRMYSGFEAASEGRRSIDVNAWTLLSNLPAQIRLRRMHGARQPIHEANYRQILARRCDSGLLDDPEAVLELDQTTTAELVQVFLERGEGLVEEARAPRRGYPDLPPLCVASPQKSESSDEMSPCDESKDGSPTLAIRMTALSAEVMTEGGSVEDTWSGDSDEELAKSTSTASLGSDSSRRNSRCLGTVFEDESYLETFDGAVDNFLENVTAAMNVRQQPCSEEVDLTMYSGNDANVIWCLVQQVVASIYGTACVQIYGSFATGLWLPGQSDLDLLISFQRVAYPRSPPGLLPKSVSPIAMQPRTPPGTSSASFDFYDQEQRQNAPAFPAHAPPSTSKMFPVPSLEMVDLDRKQMLVYLYALHSALKVQPWCKSIKLIKSSAMPVIKMIGVNTINSKPAEVPVDISFRTSDHYGIQARDYVLQLTADMPHVLRPLVLVLKRLLREYELNDVYKGGLGSYTLTILVVFFLLRCGFLTGQEGGKRGLFVRTGKSIADKPVVDIKSLPPLVSPEQLADMPEEHKVRIECASHAIEAATRDVKLALETGDKKVGIGALLVGFLRLFAHKGGLDLASVGLSLANRGRIFIPKQPMSLCLMDPIVQDKEIGGGSFQMAVVQRKFSHLLHQILAEPTELERLLAIGGTEHSAAPPQCNENPQVGQNPTRAAPRPPVMLPMAPVPPVPVSLSGYGMYMAPFPVHLVSPVGYHPNAFTFSHPNQAYYHPQAHYLPSTGQCTRNQHSISTGTADLLSSNEASTQTQRSNHC